MTPPAWYVLVAGLILCLAPLEAGSISCELTNNIIYFTPNSSRGDGNPFRGLVAYAPQWYNQASAPSIRFSMEFVYVALSEILPWDGVVDLASVIEPRITDVDLRGRMAILRIYLDFVHNKDSKSVDGLPLYLRERVPYQQYKIGGKYGQSPDYDDPDLVQAMLEAVAAFGAEYDGDTRVAFVEVGLLGFDGEWATYPYDGQKESYPDLMPSPATRALILTAFDRAFNSTIVMASLNVLRNWDAQTEAALQPLVSTFGWHDPRIGASTACCGETGKGIKLDGTLHHLEVLKLLDERGLGSAWVTVPFGGVIDKAIEDEAVWTSTFDTLYTDITTFHTSWMVYQYVFTPYGSYAYIMVGCMIVAVGVTRATADPLCPPRRRIRPDHRCYLALVRVSLVITVFLLPFGMVLVIIGSYEISRQLGSTAYQNALNIHSSLGYNFHVEYLSLQRCPSGSDSATTTTTTTTTTAPGGSGSGGEGSVAAGPVCVVATTSLVNRGNAPFYHDLAFVAIHDGVGSGYTRVVLDEDARYVYPGQARQYAFSVVVDDPSRNFTISFALQTESAKLPVILGTEPTLLDLVGGLVTLTNCSH